MEKDIKNLENVSGGYVGNIKDGSGLITGYGVFNNKTGKRVASFNFDGSMSRDKAIDMAEAFDQKYNG